ncbi:MAG: HD domain-containing phosphohydrolase, partial [Comamonadaceae bacterium]|nr:HD domain-containing phosphohydrolase [Comamonadaceae bacterium]
EIDLDILNKPGPLDEAEMGQMKLHPVKGHAILQTCMEDAAILDACLHHHERLDGKGYPHGLSNEQLTRLTRMTAICDIYDAITSDRPYKKGWSPTEALQRMKQWCHAHIDAQIFEVFVRTIGVYPLGSLVRMQSGLLGVVCGSASSSMSRPKVMVFYHIGLQRMLRTPQVVDLEKMTEECIADSEEPSQWPTLNMEQLCQKAAKLVNLA